LLALRPLSGRVRPQAAGGYMTNQEALTLVGVSIAFASFCANVVMGISLYRLSRRNVKHDKDLDTLRELFQRLEATHLFTMDPEQEIWEFGFEILKEINTACSTAVVAVQTSRVVPAEVKSAVEGMAIEVRKLREYQDSWRTFRTDKSGDWRDVQQHWPDLGFATSTLTNAKGVAAECKRKLLNYLIKIKR
jgi:hypothetical protein